MKKSINAAAAMRNAHSIRRHASQVWHLPVSSIDMGECLKMAWNGYTPDTMPAPADAIRLQYDAMDDNARNNWINAMCRKFVAAETGESTSENDGISAVEHLSKTTERYFLNLCRDGWNDLTQSAHMAVLAYIRTPGRLEAMNAERADDGRAPITLGSIIWRAAHTAVQSVKRDAMKQARMGFVSMVNGETGETINVADKTSGNDYRRVEIMDMLERACRDDADHLIVDALMDGMNQTEIAEKLGISQQAVAKRIKGIRARCAA